MRPEAPESVRPAVAPDQAAGLRRLFAPRAPAVLAVAQTSARAARLVANLAAAAAANGCPALVLDESCGSVARMLGVPARWELAHALAGDLRLERALLTVRPGLTVLPATRGLALAARDGHTLASLFGAGVELPELVILHTADPAVAARIAARPLDTLLVVDGEADSLANAYLALKCASASMRPALLGHWSDEGPDGVGALDALAAAAQRFLHRAVPFAGLVPADPALIEAARCGRSVFEIDAEAASARALRSLAARVLARIAFACPPFVPPAAAVH
jgi:MinD-like ATPase involved in chromosome partitioning or flagellar assembly